MVELIVGHETQTEADMNAKFKAMNNRQKAKIMTDLHRAFIQLEQNGWEHIASVLSDDNGEDSGMVFTRGRERFLLNMNTVSQLRG
jgi:hypothetical protein